MTVLLVEDDHRISKFLLKGLAENSYRVTLAETGEEAREILNSHDFDLILMDVMLPAIDGIQLTEMIRFKKNYTPIIALSALNSSDDKIKMLDIGADDYLSKPFHFDELLSRMKAMMRRSNFSYENDISTIQCGNLVMNTELYSVTQNQKKLDFSPTEFKLLKYLFENKNKVLTRTQILHNVWGIDFDSATNVVDVYISYIRNKIDESEIKLIHTIKGIGYMLTE